MSSARSEPAAPSIDRDEPRVCLELLGPIRVVVGGAPFVVDTRKASAILAVLAVEGPQRRERLTTLLWPDRDPSHAAGAFRRTLSVLNTALGPGVLVSDRQEIGLTPGAVATDVGRFDAMVTSTETHDHAASGICSACREPLEVAVGLHRGPFLDGFTVREAPEFDDWQMSWTERFERGLCRALDRLTRIELDAGRLDAALQHTESWLACEPLNEQVHGRLMFLHARRGERNQAIQRYRDCVAVLDRELGVRPLERTNQLYRALLEGKIDPIQAPGAPPVTSRPSSPARQRPVETQTLVGRGPELDHAEQQLDQGTVLAIRGEAGIGKTRFVEELEARLHRREAAMLVGRCQPDERHLSFGPVMDLIRAGMALPEAADRLAGLNRSWVVEASRLVPELSEHPAPTGRSDLPGAQTRLLDGLAHVVAGILADRKLRVVLLEDLHNADEATMDLITYLSRRLEEHRLSLVLTYRDEELRTSSFERRLVVESDGHVCELERLDHGAVVTYLRSALGDRSDLTPLTERVWRETEGLPLAIVEYTRWLADAEPDAEGTWPVPIGVRELVRSRLASLSDTARQVVSAVAVAGRDVDEHLVRRVAGRTDEETLAGLEELVERGLLRPSETGFDFVHDRIRTVAYEDTNAARRRLLHARVAEALATRVRPAVRLAGIIAEHARLGGNDEEAAHWSVRAGDDARSVFANAEARQHYEQALALGPVDLASVHARLARLEVLDGNYSAALAAYETAAAHADEPLAFAAIEHELGALHLRRRSWSTARAHLETALTAVDGQDEALTARITADLGLLELTTGDPESAARRAGIALRLAENVRDHAAVAQARNVAGLLARRRGHITEAQRHFEQAAALASATLDPSAYIAALNNLALTTAEAGDDARAVRLLTTALTRCEEQGDRHRRAALLNNLADMHHRRGDQGRSMELMKQAVVQFAEVGEARSQEPEIWQLTEW